MKRIDYIRNMTTEEMAEKIVEINITDAYCKSDCVSDFNCPHELECCMRWLESEGEVKRNFEAISFKLNIGNVNDRKTVAGILVSNGYMVREVYEGEPSLWKHCLEIFEVRTENCMSEENDLGGVAE
ncbi:MAG: hypothetical protein BWY67_01477 [Bacteroidetes bacterium ADurb.Bin397]|nr:MAG: hypothetical protein BWY67_01477 [Bacteroidetes bacterium ADurb.Bin397]